MLLKPHKIAILVSLFLLAGALHARGGEIAPPYQAKRTILVVHDLAGPVRAGGLTITDLKTLLRHYDAFVADVSFDRYAPGQMDGYDAVLFIGSREHTSAELNVFLQDLLRAYKSKTVCWVNAGVKTFLAASGLLEKFSVLEPAGTFNILSYKDTKLRNIDRSPYLIRGKPEGEKEFATYGEFINRGNRTPFALSAGKFWYFSILPENADDRLVFCDLLHPVLLEGKEHDAEPGKIAVLVLKGIGSATDLSKLADLTNSFWENGVPFMLGIEPFQHQNNAPKALSKNPYLVRNITAALANNGTALLQGSSVTTETKVKEGIAEMLKDDVIPLAFLDLSPKKESGSENAIEDHFSTFVGYRDIPFFSYDEKFQAIVPLAMDLSKEQEKAGYPVAFREAERRCVLRDAVLGFTVDVNAEKKLLVHLIRQLKSMRYAFLDLKHRPNYVRSERAIVVSEPSYYEHIPLEAFVYGNKTKTDLIRFQMTGDFLVEKLLTHKFSTASEKAYALPLNGTALIDIPNRWGILLVEKTDKKPEAIDKLEKPLMAFLLGKSSQNLTGDVYRVIVIILFAVTLILLIYLIYMFLFEEWVRKTFRGI